MAERKKKEPVRKWYEYVTDPAIALAKGAVDAGDSMVGLANLAGGVPVALVNRGLELASRVLPFESYGYNPEIVRQGLDSFRSEAQKRADAEVAGRQGIGNKFQAALNNPSTIGNTFVELAPSVASAAGMGKRLVVGGTKKMAARNAAIESSGILSRMAPSTATKATNAAWSGAVGEGMMGVGGTEAQIRQQQGNKVGVGLRSPSEYGQIAGQGLLNAGIGYLGGVPLRALRKFSPDVDTAIIQRGYAAAEPTAQRMPFYRPEFGTGGNRGVMLSTAGETALETPMQQGAEYLGNEVQQGAESVGQGLGFLPQVRAQAAERKDKKRP